MPAMGPVPEGQRYIVVIEIPGPKQTPDANKVNELLGKLRELGAELKIQITGRPS
jgi:hypothetical protein